MWAYETQYLESYIDTYFALLEEERKQNEDGVEVCGEIYGYNFHSDMTDLDGVVVSKDRSKCEELSEPDITDWLEKSSEAYDNNDTAFDDTVIKGMKWYSDEWQYLRVFYEVVILEDTLYNLLDSLSEQFNLRGLGTSAVAELVREKSIRTQKRFFYLDMDTPDYPGYEVKIVKSEHWRF